MLLQFSYIHDLVLFQLCGLHLLDWLVVTVDDVWSAHCTQLGSQMTRGFNGN